MKGLAERLQELRTDILDLSQKELAARIGVSRSTLASWESGHRKPELDHLETLAQIGKVSVDWLLGRSDDRRSPSGGSDVARATSDPGGEELVVVFRGKRQKLDPAYQKLLIKMLEDDTNEEDAKSQP